MLFCLYCFELDQTIWVGILVQRLSMMSVRQHALTRSDIEFPVIKHANVLKQDLVAALFFAILIQSRKKDPLIRQHHLSLFPCVAQQLMHLTLQQAICDGWQR